MPPVLLNPVVSQGTKEAASAMALPLILLSVLEMLLFWETQPTSSGLYFPLRCASWLRLWVSIFYFSMVCLWPDFILVVICLGKSENRRWKTEWRQKVVYNRLCLLAFSTLQMDRMRDCSWIVLSLELFGEPCHFLSIPPNLLSLVCHVCTSLFLEWCL